MNHQKLSHRAISSVLVALFLTACGVQPATPTPVPPTATPIPPTATPTPKPSAKYSAYFEYVVNLNTDFDSLNEGEMRTQSEQLIKLESPLELADKNVELAQAFQKVALALRAYATAKAKDAISGGFTALDAQMDYMNAKLDVYVAYAEWEVAAESYLAQYGEELPTRTP